MANRKDQYSPDWANFSGYQSPNYTNVPDQLFDEHLAFLTGAELKVLLYVVRRTFGFKRDFDSISISQMLKGIVTREGRVLDHGVGLSKPTLLAALRSLIEKNLIVSERQRSVERGDEPTIYRLRLFASTHSDDQYTRPVVKKFDQGGGQKTSPGPWSKKLTTQDTGEQETERDIFRTSKGSAPNKKKQATIETGGPPTTAVSDENVVARSTLPPEPSPHGVLEQAEAAQNALGNQGSRSRRSTTGFTRINDVLPTVTPSLFQMSTETQPGAVHNHVRPIPRSDLPTSITTVVREFLEQERGTPEHFRGTLARLTTLYHATGLADDAFLGVVIEAKEAARTGRPPTRITRFVTQITDRVRLLQLEQLAEHHHPGSAIPAQSPVQPQRRARKDRQHLLAFIKDFSVEFGDEAPLASSVTRAHNLYQRSGLSLEQFTSLLYEARALTKEHMGGITKEQQPRAGSRLLWGRGINSMPYFFACLEGLIAPDEHVEAEASP